MFPFAGRTAYKRLHKRLQAYCERAGIQKRPFHALRATCIKSPRRRLDSGRSYKAYK
ncbi:hypothetical protein [Methanosarcina acetivorans]|nr:hypothetical protein [Methanosarcina acetivorans]